MKHLILLVVFVTLLIDLTPLSAMAPENAPSDMQWRPQKVEDWRPPFLMPRGSLPESSQAAKGHMSVKNHVENSTQKKERQTEKEPTLSTQDNSYTKQPANRHGSGKIDPDIPVGGWTNGFPSVDKVILGIFSLILACYLGAKVNNPHLLIKQWDVDGLWADRHSIITVTVENTGKTSATLRTRAFDCDLYQQRVPPRFDHARQLDSHVRGVKVAPEEIVSWQFQTGHLSAVQVQGLHGKGEFLTLCVFLYVEYRGLFGCPGKLGSSVAYDTSKKQFIPISEPGYNYHT